MNLNDAKYADFALVRDMLATPEIVARFDPAQVNETATAIAKTGRLIMTGEGSSRIFPAKHSIYRAKRAGWKLMPLTLHNEGARQALEYNLSEWAVFGASNSGRTSEVIHLFRTLRDQGHQQLYALTATAESMLEELATKTHVLSCGRENAVAATKSVIEQAIFYHALIARATKAYELAKVLKKLADDVRLALTQEIDPALIERIASANTVYVAGRNDGVAEELTLKTNEITRKRSDYLEGTYAVHGIEEAMDKEDVLIWIDPFEDSQEKFRDVLVKGVGLAVIAISPRATLFPTIQIPRNEFQAYVNLCAGWNLLVEVGLMLGVNLDKPLRARKVGNEFVAPAAAARR